jgi:hypothetical protein
VESTNARQSPAEFSPGPDRSGRVIGKLAAWAAPVVSVAAVLCAVIAVMYASSVRVAVSIPTAADIGNASTAEPNSQAGSSQAGPEVTLVRPVHEVEVFDSPDASATSPSSEPEPAAGVAAGDDSRPSPSGRPNPTTSASEATVDDGAVDPTATWSPSTGTPSPTGSWGEDDHPSRSPTPSTSPTSTRSAWPTSSRGNGGGDDGTSDDGGNKATSTASPSP